MATKLTPSPSIVVTEQEDGLQHVVCCRDGNSRTFCGLDGSRLPWTQNDPQCVVCSDMEDATDLCPKGGCCPDVED